MADINLNFNEKELVRAAKELQKAAKSIEQAFKKVGGAAKSDADSLKKVATAAKKVATEKKKLTAIEREELRQKNALATVNAKLALANSKDNQQLIQKQALLRKVNTQLRTGGKNTASWSKALGSFQFKFNALGNIASSVASTISRSLNRAMRDAIRIVKDFDQAMADVKAITGATGKQFEALSKSAQQLGRTTRFTATEVARLQKEYAKLGFTTEEILNAQAATLALASATNTELPRAAEVVGITIKQFGLGAEETQRVVDVMAKSFTTSALDMEKFAESMKMVGPIASKAGYTLEQTTARLAQLADAGIQGTMGGTALRQIFLEMAKGGKDLGERLKALSMEELGLAEATQEVQKRAAAALLVLVDSVDTVDEYTESLNRAAGASQEMADIQLDTLAGSLDLVKSAWEGMVLAMLNTEENMSGIKWALGGIIDLLNTLALKAESGLNFAEAFTITKAIKETEQFAYKLQESRKELDFMVGGFSKVGGWMKELGKDLWNEMFPKATADVVETSFEDLINKLPEIANVMKEINFDEFDLDLFGNEEAYQKGIDNLEEYKRKLEELQEKRREAADADASATKTAEDEKAFAIQEGFAIAADAAKTFSDIFENQKQRELSAVGDNEKKRAEIEAKYLKKQKTLAIASAIMNGAMAIQKIQGQAGVFSVPLIIASAALTATQVGIIASQKFAKGGIDIKGPSHARGGIAAEIEGGESVINRRSTSKYKGLLDAINQDDQVRIQDALNRDRKIIIGGGGDPYNKKMYELMKETHNYGEDKEFYYKQVGNTIYKTKK